MKGIFFLTYREFTACEAFLAELQAYPTSFEILLFLSYPL